MVQDAETAGYRVVPPPSPDTTHDLFSPSPSHARQFFGPAGSPVGSGCGSDDCLSSNAPLSRVLMVVATLVNCVTPPYLAGLPPPLEEDDDEIEQVMAFASVKGRRSASGGGLSETGGRPFRGRSLFPGPGLIPPLSAWRENARFLSSQPSALRFAFLCAYARHSALRQLGLQLVSGLRYPLVSTTSTSVAPASVRVPRPLHLNTFTGIELVTLRFLVRCLFQSADRCDLLAGKPSLLHATGLRPVWANHSHLAQLLATAVPVCMWVCVERSAVLSRDTRRQMAQHTHTHTHVGNEWIPGIDDTLYLGSDAQRRFCRGREYAEKDGGMLTMKIWTKLSSIP
ncbi:unnamed protein product [Hydatigera taeniaeformis]|uniref:Uncharacterized protein n=1 Tax=Hydatigena taeniaeformis TaxID=6205 RepID=A0A3P7F3R6_HYDTA|nr:unnamed protein product [Hydatigera taeniaeformis]